MIWYVICTIIFVSVGLVGLWHLVKHTGTKTSFSEHLFENAFQALKDLEDYYEDFPEKQRERALKVLSGMAVELGALDREVKAEESEKKQV